MTQNSKQLLYLTTQGHIPAPLPSPVPPRELLSPSQPSLEGEASETSLVCLTGAAAETENVGKRAAKGRAGTLPVLRARQPLFLRFHTCPICRAH